jgi:uncharacterized protein (UPF0332 family)
LADAKKLADLGFVKLAARCGYYAAFHAAEAYVFERTKKAAKTHSGVRTELARLPEGHAGRAGLDARISRSLLSAQGN